MRKEIYNWIVQETPLLDQHRKELTEIRGFSPETIAKTKIRSTGQHFIEITERIKNHFTEKELIAARILIEKGTEVRMNPMLLEERLLIPYMDQAGDVYHLRPHKLGFEGINIEIYQEANLAGEPSEIILTEGELKAAAGMQYGIPTIAIPGIASFSDQHFGKLAETLNRLMDKTKKKRIIIMFDNEVKNDPAFTKRFKDEPMKRYDTQFYAVYMAKRLEKENFEVRIGHLPDSWRQDGKIDIDGALAQKKTYGEMLKVMENAKSGYEYLGELDHEAQRILKIKLARKYFHSRVSKQFGHYEAVRTGKGGAETMAPISNFILNVVATYRTAEGVIRDVRLVNELGENSGIFSIKGEEMQDAAAFNSFCYNHGNFMWWGTKDDLREVWKDEFIKDDGRHIYEPDHVGWVESERVWLFQNVAITDDGKEYHPDKNGIFWINSKGIKPVALQIGYGRNGIPEGLPSLYLHEFDVKEFMDRLADTIGREQMLVVMGLVSAMPFMEEIHDLHGCFPFLFFDGKRGSGKSSIAEWVASLAGMPNAGRMASDTTSVAVQRYLAYYSCLPFFIDEYRNEKKVKDKDGLFRNIYNRQGAGKGIKANFGIREAKIRGTLIFAGEDVPTDNAFSARCMEVFVSENQREGRANHYNWMMANQEKFSRHFYNVLKAKPALQGRFQTELQQNVDHLRSMKDLNPRVAVNYSIVVTALDVVLGIKDRAFAEWILVQARRVKKESDKTHALAEFLEGLVYLKQTKEIDEHFYDYTMADKKIWLWFDGAMNKYMEHFTRINRELTFSKEAIRKYLKDDKSFLAAGKNHRFGAEGAKIGSQNKAMVFSAETAPAALRSLVDIDETGEDDE